MIPVSAFGRLRALVPAALLLLAGCAIQPPAPEITAPQDGCLAPETAHDCDARAIKAMAGEYQVRFAFDEVSALRPGYVLKDPKRSGGDEWVTVVEDTPQRIVLQHILVDTSGMVIKHWRQDWQFEPAITWQYVGDNTWQRRALSDAERRGAWVQTVWQVDDSPRYAGVGRWVHDGNSSIWTSDRDWRPLPRREYTTRDDYDVMVAINRHEITANGWVHLQDNLKLDTHADAQHRYIARELGVNSYIPATGFDFSPARDYWQKTASFWAAVRAAWESRFAKASQIRVKGKVDGQRLWEVLFDAAETAPDNTAVIGPILDRYLDITPLKS